MHFSPITVGVTALFILSRLAAAVSSDHVDVATAPLHPGQLKPAHSRYVPHHRHEGGENGFYHSLHDHDSHPSKGKRFTGAVQEQEGRTKLRQRQLMPPSTQRAVNNMLMGALFRRASKKSHSTSPGKKTKVNYDNMAQLVQQGISISQKVSSAGHAYQEVQNTLAGIPGPARNSLTQRGVKILREFSQLQSLYSRQNKALQAAQSSYGGTEANKNLWGRELQVLPRSFDALSRRAPKKSHSAKSITINPDSLAQLEQHILTIGAQVDEAGREQQALRKALAGAGWVGNARTAIDQLASQIDVAFNQLHSLFHQPLPQSSY